MGIDSDITRRHISLQIPLTSGFDNTPGPFRIGSQGLRLKRVLLDIFIVPGLNNPAFILCFSVAVSICCEEKLLDDFDVYTNVWV